MFRWYKFGIFYFFSHFYDLFCPWFLKKKNLKNGSSEAWLWEQQPSGWETSTPQSPRTSLFLSQMKLSLHLASAKLAKTKNGKKEKSGCALSFPWYSTKQSSKPARKKSHGLIGCQIFSLILYSTAVLAGEEEEGAYITQLTPKTINLVSWKEKLSWSTVRSLFSLKLWPPQHPASHQRSSQRAMKAALQAALWWQSQNETPQIYNKWECWDTTYLHGWSTAAKLVSQKNGLALSITSWEIFTTLSLHDLLL